MIVTLWRKDFPTYIEVKWILIAVIRAKANRRRLRANKTRVEGHSKIFKAPCTDTGTQVTHSEQRIT